MPRISGRQAKVWLIKGTAAALLAATLSVSAQADPILRPEGAHDPEAVQAVHRAEHEVDQAWNAFHKAALGGTLASPAIQADVEQALHESRSLLVKAREATNRGDQTTLQPLLQRIHVLTKRAITESQEQKR